MPLFTWFYALVGIRVFRPVEGIHQIAHILLVRDAFGGFLGKSDDGLEVADDVAEKSNPGPGVELVPPD